MTETQQETPTEGGGVEQQAVEGESAELQAGISKLDDDGSNPFWPKGAGQPGTPDNPDSIAFVSVQFRADPADVDVVIKTTPVDSAWTFNAGDGTPDQPIAAGTNAIMHHYADKSAGKSYTITVTSAADSDTRKVQY